MGRPYAMASVVLGLTLSVVGCASKGDVPWEDYAPVVRTRIDGLGAAKDCAGLQVEFNNADANNQVSLNRTGHNNAALMAYIDDLMRKAGCYG